MKDQDCRKFKHDLPSVTVGISLGSAKWDYSSITQAEAPDHLIIEKISIHM
jgi:hypothetical protein